MDAFCLEMRSRLEGTVQYKYGTNFYPRYKILSTCYAFQDKMHPSKHIKRWRECLISIRHQYLSWDLSRYHTLTPELEQRGNNMQRMVFKSADAQHTIDYWNLSSLACAATSKLELIRLCPCTARCLPCKSRIKQ